MAQVKTPKMLKKKQKPIDEEKEPVSSFKILNPFKLLSKDKNGELRKSKRKLKSKHRNKNEFEGNNEHEQSIVFDDSNVLIKPDDEDQDNQDNPIVESVNEYLLHVKKNKRGCDNHSSKEASENESQSIYSDYSYNPLTTDTSEVSSREYLSDDQPLNETKSETESSEDEKNLPEPEQSEITEPSKVNSSTKKIKTSLRKSSSLKRENSLTRTFKGIFRKTKSDPQEVPKNIDQPPKLFKPAQRKIQEFPESPAKSEKLSSIRKTSSIKRKISHFMSMSDSSQSLSRSMSVRDIHKKNRFSTGSEWSTSLKSLAENDFAVSYADMSFVNYDALNTCSYDDAESSSFMKQNCSLSHSKSMHNVSHYDDPFPKSYSEDKDFERNCQSSLDLTQGEAASLPTLHNIDQNNGGNAQRYRRHYSTNSEDSTIRTKNVSRIRSSGSGCSKLKRQNACRQISRDSNPSLDPADNVRSRSLNHLDTLDHSVGRQSSENLAIEADSSDGPLKDSLSEPDCTMARPGERLLTVPPQDSSSSSAPSDKSKTTTTGRRQMLSRSQVSSSEYFSVSFELGEDSTLIHGKEEFLPATKGTTLSEALAKVCERRSIELSNCDIYLDGCKSTSYLLHQETSALGGKSIRITGKEASNKKSTGNNHFRKSSGSYRGRTGLFFSTSTEDSSILSGSTSLLFQDESKKQKQRWSGFFSNNKDTKMESLADQLNYYSQHESFRTLISEGQDEMVNALYNLEEDWREILEPAELSEKQQQQQTAIWELIATEVAYIKTLRVVTGLFLACLESLQNSNILTEINREKLFSNITEILECNFNFWSTYIYPAVQRMRIYKKPISPLMFHDGFVRMAETYHPYFRYCAEQARCQHYCKENHAHNEVFTAYLVWCETQKECNRLRLMDILVRPMQRLTKYGLLLKAIFKNTEDEYEKDCLCTMIKSVDDFVNSVNSSLRQKQDNERLRGIIARLESYDVVETKDDDIQVIVQKYNQLDLSQPMPGCPPERRRHLLLEGDLKLKDATSSKMEVHCFLLTDVLLVCKPSSKKGSAMMRVIRQPYLVDRLVITELNRETPSLALVYLNEFKTASAAFILQNSDQKKLKAWADCIRKAQGLYEQAKHMPSMGLMRQLSSSVHGDDFYDPDYNLEFNIEGESQLHSLIPRSPIATSSRASRGSSLAHSHSGSVEMNDQSSVGSINQSRGISIENENRTASISSDEGIQPLPADKSPINQKNSLKQRLLSTSPKTLTPNTLSVQPYANLGQSLPNLTLGSPNVGTINITHHNTLLVPSTKNGQLLSPHQRGISYPPPSPTRGNLRRGFAITQNKNPPLIKTGHVNSTLGATCLHDLQEPTCFDFDVPVIAGVSPPDDLSNSFSRGQHRQAMTKRGRGDSRRYHTAGIVDDIKKNDEKDVNILKRLSWNCGPTNQSQAQTEDHAT